MSQRNIVIDVHIISVTKKSTKNEQKYSGKVKQIVLTVVSDSGIIKQKGVKKMDAIIGFVVIFVIASFLFGK